MDFFNKNKLPALLILGSLLLLLLFQGVWLKSSYDQEKENLREQSDRIFMDAIREIEDSILRIAILDINNLICDDSTTFSDLQTAFGINSDYVDNIKKSVHTTSTSIPNLDTAIRIDIRTDVSTYQKDKRFGSLSFLVATSDSSDLFSHPFLEDCEENNLTQELLNDELKGMMPTSNLPQDYELALLKDGKKETGFYSSTQTDILRGGGYALYFPNYRFFLFK